MGSWRQESSKLEERPGACAQAPQPSVPRGVSARVGDPVRGLPIRPSWPLPPCLSSGGCFQAHVKLWIHFLLNGTGKTWVVRLSILPWGPWRRLCRPERHSLRTRHGGGLVSFTADSVTRFGADLDSPQSQDFLWAGRMYDFAYCFQYIR